MHNELSEEQRQVLDLCRELAENELKPNARRWDAEHAFPAEAVKKLGSSASWGSPSRRSGAVPAWTP